MKPLAPVQVSGFDEQDAVPVEDAKPAPTQSRNGRATQRRPQARDPRRAVKPTVPNPAARGNGTKTGAGSGAAPKKDSTPANGKASTEIPGLISDRSRRKKQDRKRG